MKTFTASSKTLLSNAALGVVGVALVSTMVVRASSATFTGTTENAGNTWAAGTVTLANNKTSALFTTATTTGNLRPGDSGTECIEVTYTGSLTPAEAIRIHGEIDGGTPRVDGETLADNLDIVLDIYPDGATCLNKTTIEKNVYTGTLKALPATYAAGGLTGWTPAGGANKMRAFTLKYTLNSNTGNDAQSDTATAKFVWEARSSVS